MTLPLVRVLRNALACFSQNFMPWSAVSIAPPSSSPPMSCGRLCSLIEGILPTRVARGGTALAASPVVPHPKKGETAHESQAPRSKHYSGGGHGRIRLCLLADQLGQQRQRQSERGRGRERGHRQQRCERGREREPRRERRQRFRERQQLDQLERLGEPRVVGQRLHP